MTRSGTEPAAITLVAVTEVCRTWRRIRRMRSRDAASGVLLVVAYVAVAWVGALLFTDAVLLGGEPALSLTRSVVLAAMVTGTAGAVYRTVTETGSLDASESLLLATTPIAVAIGVLGAEYARALLYHGPALGAVVVGFWLATGDPIAAATLALVALLAVVLVVAVGFAVGFLLKYAASASRGLSSTRVGIALVVACSAAAVLGVAAEPGGLVRRIGRFPPAWITDLALIGLPGVSPPSDRVGAAIAALLVGPILFGAVGVHLATRVWLGDAVSRVDGPGPERRRTPALDRLLGDRVSTTARRVAVTAWLRGRRSPVTVIDGLSAYLVPITFALFSVVLEGRVPWWTTYGIAGAGVVATGSVFTLNPLGGQEAVLPITLTSGVEPRAFLWGLALVSWIVGLPLTVAGTVLAGVATGTGLLTVAVASGAIAVGAPGIGMAAGVAFPSFERNSLPGGQSVTSPSLLAAVVLVVAVTVGVSPLVNAILGPSPDPLAIVRAGLLSAVFVSLTGWMGARYAADRFGKYVLDCDRT